MDPANNVVVTYSRVAPAPLDPQEPLPRGPILEAVEVPHVHARSRGDIDSVVPESVDPGNVAPGEPRRRAGALGRVMLVGAVAFVAGVGLLAMTLAMATRNAPKVGTPAPASIASTPPAATTPAPAVVSAPAAASPAANGGAPMRQVPLGGGRPDFSSAAPGPQFVPQPAPGGSSATPSPVAQPAASASAPVEPAQPPAPKARPEQTAKAPAAPAPAIQPQAMTPPQPQPNSGEFTANIERLLTRPAPVAAPPAVATLPQNPVVIVPDAPPVATVLPNGVTIGSVEPLPLPPSDPFLPPASIGPAAPRGPVPPADIPNLPPAGTLGGLPPLR